MKPTHILLVEDDPVLNEQLTNLLSKNGYKVANSFDGEKGLAMAISEQYRYELREWSKEAKELYFSEGQAGLDSWLSALRAQEQPWLAVAKFEVAHVAGDPLILPFRDEYTLGRSVDWKIHLYFEENPVTITKFYHDHPKAR